MNVTYFVFCAPPKTQLFRISQNFSVPGPFLQVSLQGPKTCVLGDNLPHSEKKLEFKQKSYIFCLFLPNYYVAIASEGRNLVASERKWKEVLH